MPNSPQDYAINVLEDLSIDLSSQIDPFLIAKRLLGREVVLRDVDGFDGMLLNVDNERAIIVNNLIREEGRKRFTCAHEIGHYVITSHREEAVRCTEADIATLDIKKRLEREANEFASELLIPSKVLKGIIDGQEPRKELIESLSERFGTTLTATVWKYVLNSDLCCALVVSKNSRTVWCVKSDFFRLHTYLLDNLYTKVLVHICALEARLLLRNSVK